MKRLPIAMMIAVLTCMLFTFPTVALAGTKHVDNLRVNVPMNPPSTQDFSFYEGTYLVTLAIDYHANEAFYGESYTRLMPVELGVCGVRKRTEETYNVKVSNGLAKVSTIIYIENDSLLRIQFSAGAPLGAIGILNIERF